MRILPSLALILIHKFHFIFNEYNTSAALDKENNDDMVPNCYFT